jgi:general secretion pathway protein G
MLTRIRKSLDAGFTLIELLIVIVILGILAAVVVFAVGTTGSSSARGACQSDVKTVETAVEAFKAESTTSAYPADIAAVVSGGYLREAPSSTHYTITTAAGAVTVKPLPTGSAVSLTPGGTETAQTACAGVS